MYSRKHIFSLYALTLEGILCGAAMLMQMKRYLTCLLLCADEPAPIIHCAGLYTLQGHMDLRKPLTHNYFFLHHKQIKCLCSSKGKSNLLYPGCCPMFYVGQPKA